MFINQPYLVNYPLWIKQLANTGAKTKTWDEEYYRGMYHLRPYFESTSWPRTEISHSLITQPDYVGNLPENFHFFHQYWILSQSKGATQYSVHADFKLWFFVCMDRKGLYNVVGLEKFYLRWKTAHSLIFNLIYFDSNVMAFTNKIFFEESLVFNWKLSKLSYKMFKYAQETIYTLNTPYGNSSRLLFNYMNVADTDAAIVSDAKLHEKNIFFLTRTHYYTIGLIPANYSPWRFHFPIPLLNDSLLGQFYFLNMVTRLVSYATRTRFLQNHRNWVNLMFSLSNPTVNFQFSKSVELGKHDEGKCSIQSPYTNTFS